MAQAVPQSSGTLLSCSVSYLLCQYLEEASSACMGAKVVEAEDQRAKPGEHGTFPKVPALFPAEPPMSQDHPLRCSSVISTRREHLLLSGSEQSSQALMSLQIVLWRLLLLSNRDLGYLKLAVVARGCPCHPRLLPGALGSGLSLPGLSRPG